MNSSTRQDSTPSEQPASNSARSQVLKGFLEKYKITPNLLTYVENFHYPYMNNVSSYELVLKIGQGTFGEVFKARCKRTGNQVALKKILLENEKEGFPITALREIKMLQKLKHANITELIEICSSKQKRSREKISFYLVFTFCEHDLAGILSHNKIKLSLAHIKTIVQHILRGLCRIHTLKILHRDMKAANVLITKDGVLKLADFGLARFLINNNQDNNQYTNRLVIHARQSNVLLRVVTLWYRPPELLLGTRHYGPAIDIWGAGCIMAELWTKIPILQGETEQKQLILISLLCGSINTETCPGCDKLPYYSRLELPQNQPRKLREKMSQSNPQLASCEQALSLIDQMLELSPSKRPTAEVALDHLFFFQNPIPPPNIRDLIDQLPTNMFEYTTACGAHAHRKRPAQSLQMQGPPRKQQAQPGISDSSHHVQIQPQARTHAPQQRQPSSTTQHTHTVRQQQNLTNQNHSGFASNSQEQTNQFRLSSYGSHHQQQQRYQHQTNPERERSKHYGHRNGRNDFQQNSNQTATSSSNSSRSLIRFSPAHSRPQIKHQHGVDRQQTWRDGGTSGWN